jgi:hypothetical protein
MAEAKAIIEKLGTIMIRMVLVAVSTPRPLADRSGDDDARGAVWSRHAGDAPLDDERADAGLMATLAYDHAEHDMGVDGGTEFGRGQI